MGFLGSVELKEDWKMEYEMDHLHQNHSSCLLQIHGQIHQDDQLDVR